MPKLTYKASFESGRLALKIYDGASGLLIDEIRLPNLPTFTLSIPTQALWKSFFQSLNEED